MMNREQARAHFESDAWKSLSDYELVKLQLYEDRLCVPFSAFHAAIGRVLNRPVFTHEFATNFIGLLVEFEAIPPPTKANGHVYHHAAVQSPNPEINQGSEACIVTRNQNNTNIGEPHDPR